MLVSIRNQYKQAVIKLCRNYEDKSVCVCRPKVQQVEKVIRMHQIEVRDKIISFIRLAT